MKISIEWLRSYVEPVPAPGDLAELLTRAGLEVEGVSDVGLRLERVVVAEIRSSERHPNADRLSVCQVDDGSGQGRQIVCGARNYSVGDRVPLALPGAVLPGDFRIGVSKVRGVESHGMMCSSEELGLGPGADGLLILPHDTRLGAPIGEIFPPDTVLDLEITPNRPDLLSHYGVAREIAALTRARLCPPVSALPEPARGVRGVEIRLDRADLCPIYTARRIRGVKVGQSPAWLRRRLEAVGLRPINSIVDLTNYVLLETGQPLHAFDAEKLRGEIVVRAAREGEEFLALDGRRYVLGPGHLVIADSARAVAVAGVMGGEETGVTESTTEVILESAYFDPANVRRTSRQLGLLSDSSYRFERGIDPGSVGECSDRATRLILEVAGGSCGPLSRECGPGVEEGLLRPGRVAFRPERANRLLGVHLRPGAMEKMLIGLGLERVEPDGKRVIWEVPTYRRDLAREVDLIEEIARVYGIERVEARTAGWMSGSSDADRRYDAAMRVRRSLAAAGFAEVTTLTLLSRADLRDDMFGEGRGLDLRNPMSEDHVALRPSLVPGLLRAVDRNIRMGAESIRLFEVGHVFAPSDGGQSMRVGLALTGGSGEATWRAKAGGTFDLYDMIGAVGSLGVGPVSARRVEGSTRALDLELRLGETRIGRVGAVVGARRRELDLRHPLFVAELELDALFPLLETEPSYRLLPRFPAVTRDVAIVAPAGVAHGEILAAIEGGADRHPLLESVSLFDLFVDPTGERVEAGCRSLAYSLTYRAADRTLTEKDVNDAHASILARLRRLLPSLRLRE